MIIPSSRSEPDVLGACDPMCNIEMLFEIQNCGGKADNFGENLAYSRIFNFQSNTDKLRLVRMSIMRNIFKVGKLESLKNA